MRVKIFTCNFQSLIAAYFEWSKCDDHRESPLFDGLLDQAKKNPDTTIAVNICKR